MSDNNLLDFCISVRYYRIETAKNVRYYRIEITKSVRYYRIVVDGSRFS